MHVYMVKVIVCFSLSPIIKSWLLESSSSSSEKKKKNPAFISLIIRRFNIIFICSDVKNAREVPPVYSFLMFII